MTFRLPTSGPVRLVALLAALAAPAFLGAATVALAPAASAQDSVVRGYIPPDELVSFPSSTPMNQFFRLVNPTFARVTGKRVVDPLDRVEPIGVSLNGVHFIDAFEVVLDRNGLDFSESDGYFIVTEPAVVSATTDGESLNPIGAAAPVPEGVAGGTAVGDLPATADTREIRIDAVIFQLNTRRAREVGTNWAALFGEAASQTSGSTSGAGDTGKVDFFVNAGSFFDALDGFLEASSDRVDLTTVLQLFRFFEEQGYGQTIATPFTVVQSGEKGRMQSGQDIPINTRDFQGNTQTTFFSTGTIIDVTPTLIVDERDGAPVEFVHLDLKVEKSTAVPVGDGIAINKDDITTQVNLLSGEMAAIGGLTSTDEVVSRRGVPVLRSIPLIKYLFSYEQRSVSQNEIIIVTRARVVDALRTRMGRDGRRGGILQEEQRDARERVREFGAEPSHPVIDEIETDRDR